MSPSAYQHFLFFFLLLLLFSSPSLIAAQSLYNVCGTTGNFTANSTYQTNLNRLLSTLSLNASASGFASTSVGQVPNLVIGLALCRGDVNTTECRGCLDTASQDSQQICPFNRAAIFWYDFCFLRFSNEQFLGSTSNDPEVLLGNAANVSSPQRFSRLLNLLLNSTLNNATGSDTRFATGVVSNYTAESPTVYGLVQCMPYLSASQCQQCVLGLFNPLPTFLEGRQGGRVLGAVCTMRYEIYSFFEGAPTLRLTVPPENATSPAAPPAAAPPLPVPASGQGKKRNVTGTVLAIVIPSVTAISLIFLIFICYCRRKPAPRYETEAEKIISVESILFDLATLQVATAFFSEDNKLGEGGFGAVYKGFLPNGQEIAVKKLLNAGQGLAELKNELLLVAKLQHRNLVKLIGVCLEEEKMLIYEYVPNRSLDLYLYDPVRGKELRWGTRYKIISGIAQGLLYLHEESQIKIIHRDLKASNILLDAEMNPKISDFGLAKLFDGDQTQGTTNRVIGTFGYMAPEYAMHGKFSMKSDVFSFGVLVLEVLTGRKNSGSYDSETAEDLLSFAWEKWSGGAALEAVDPVLGDQYQRGDVLRCLQIGLLCVQENPSDRPSMRTVDLMLSSETVSVQIPSKPAFCGGKSFKDVQVSDSSSLPFGVPEKSRTRSMAMSPNEVSISELEPR
ncbi:cysteine-rich receptor-like protein kinase 10 isoform X2 [Curcuma longa]|uniref:cysteine-rich receptor-like protein kinase 10 isoform X2 n=1 Tax=Curcuma longa TaxID=136217 RepID=UPI003D9F61DE